MENKEVGRKKTFTRIKLIFVGVVAHNRSGQFPVEHQENTGPGKGQPDSLILLIVVIGPLN